MRLTVVGAVVVVLTALALLVVINELRKRASEGGTDDAA